MISKEHKKHADLARASYGNFGRNEWAIIGTQCFTIKALANTIIHALSPSYKCAYVDAEHTKEGGEISLPGRLVAGAGIEYTNHVYYHQFDYLKKLNQFEFRRLFANTDVVFINGNHSEAKAQVVVIDSSKKSSLQKKMSQLTNVQLILLADSENEVFDFVKETVPAWNRVPLFRLSETEKIIDFFKQQMKLATPLLNGLVLAGGKSVRMGYDKSLIDWHGKEQRYYIADMLKGFCNDVFISCRGEQQDEIDKNYKTLADSFTGLGPYGAILTAFREQPDCAWLVVACDLPLLDSETLQNLIQHRDCSAMATTYESSFDGLPEPLITIWEPKSYPVLVSFLSQGYSCPRKVLRNSDTRILKAMNPDKLMNVNTPEDNEKAKAIIRQKTATA